MDVDEPHVVVAIRRGKTPRTATRLHGQQHAHLGFGFDRLQFLDHRFLHGTRRSQSCVSSSSNASAAAMSQLGGSFAVNMSRSHSLINSLAMFMISSKGIFPARMSRSRLRLWPSN